MLNVHPLVDGVYLSNTESLDLWAAAKRQWRVIFALLLRNIRTKFFGSGFGYIVAIAWPLTHILILVAIFTLSGRVPPYGDSSALFIGTGVTTFMVFSYQSRFMMYAVVRARALLNFPEVRVLDLLFSSALLELLSCTSVIIILIIIAWFAGVDVAPKSIVQLAYAFGATALLGLGFGLCASLMGLVSIACFNFFQLFMIVLWVSSGIFFVPDALPAPLRTVASYHPVLQCVEWVRSAYYDGYGSLVLDRQYVLGVGIVMTFLGLALERFVRGYVLSAR